VLSDWGSCCFSGYVNQFFDAKIFVERLQSGEFDGNIHSELQKLTLEQLEEVARLVVERFPDLTLPDRQEFGTRDQAADGS